ncbi:hypothetical protein Tco_0595726 [Tanacetum coccineum]
MEKVYLYHNHVRLDLSIGPTHYETYWAKWFGLGPGKLEALTSINVSKAIDKVVHAKVLTKMKKLLPTHVPKSLEKYVKPRLNNSVHEVMQNHQISLFTKPSTSTDDLSEMELKLRLLNRIQLNKSTTTHHTHQKLYDTLYDSITLDQESLDVQDAKPSFYKRTHDNQDPPNDRKAENMKKRRKDADEPSSKSLRKDKSRVERPRWFIKKSGLADAAKRRTTWFDLLLELYIVQNENHILGPSTVAIAKKLKELIQKDELTIDDLEGIEDMILDRWSKEVHRYQIEALNAIHHWEDARHDFFKAYINNRSPGKVYSDKRIISVVRVDVKRK